MWWGVGGIAAAVVIVVSVLFASGVFGGTPEIAEGLTPAQVEEVVSRSHVEGSPEAPVTLIEFGDFQCPFCRDFWAGPLEAVREAYVETGVVKIAFHHMAFLGQESHRAAEAAECAGDQGMFFEYHDVLYERQGPENQSYLTTPRLLDFGEQVGLDMAPFESCVLERTYLEEVVEDTAYASSIGVNSTPTVLVDGERFANPLDRNGLVAAIEAARTEEGSS